MTTWKSVLLALNFVTFAAEPDLHKVRFREGAEYCAVAALPEEWIFPPGKWPRPFAPGDGEIRKDSALPAPGYLIRWSGEYGLAPGDYSLNVFRLEWTSAKPEFVPIQAVRWDRAQKVESTFRTDPRIGIEGEFESPSRIVGGKRFGRSGKRWTGTDSDAILSADAKWLVLESTDGRIVRETIFGPGPNRPLAGLAHIDVYHVPSGKRTIRLEIKMTGPDGLDALFGETRIFESRYLFLRVDPRPQRTHFLVCKLPAEP